MPRLRLLSGLVLLLAPSARGQRLSAPVEIQVRPGFSAPVPALTVPAFAAPGLLVPTAPLTPALSAPSAPAPLKLSNVSAAVAQFAALDVRSAPAAEVRAGADALMARALGVDLPDAPSAPLGAPSAGSNPLSSVAPGAARVPASDPGVHLLSKPLRVTVELGPVARALHYILEIAMQLLKAAIAWQATGSPAAGLSVLAFELIKMPPMITAQSLADLGLRYWARKLSTLRRLAGEPGVTRIRVLTTGEAEFSGILARRKENTGLVFMSASGALPAEIPGFGAPIPVADLDGRTVRLTLVHDGAADALDWTPTLSELLSGSAIPARVAEAWRARLDADKKHKSPLRRLFDFKKEKELRVEARLSDGLGGETPLGTVVFGTSVKRLIGLGRLDRLGALFGRSPAPRSIPLSDTIVERGGERRVKGFARRAWSRLTGALIVKP